MLMVQCRTHRFCNPVGIHASDYIVVQFAVVDETAGILVIGRRLEQSGIIFSFQCLLGIHQMIAAKIRNFHGSGVRICEMDSARFGRNCLNDNDSIGSSGTIDGRCGCIFKSRDAFHAIHIQVVDRGLVDFEAIQYEDRCARIVFQCEFTHVSGYLVQFLDFGYPGTSSYIIF